MGFFTTKEFVMSNYQGYKKEKFWKKTMNWTLESAYWRVICWKVRMRVVMKNQNLSMSGKKETENEIENVTEVAVETEAVAGTGKRGEGRGVQSEDPTETRTGRETKIERKRIVIVDQRKEAEGTRFQWRKRTSFVLSWV